MPVLKITLIAIVLAFAGIALIGFVFMQQDSFGGSPEGKRLERIAKSPHYANGSFQNLSPTPMMAEDASYIGVTLSYLTKSDTEPPTALPSVKRDLATVVSTQPTITWFGHSSLLLQVQGNNILIDPVFSERGSPVQWAGNKSYAGTFVYSLADLPPIDYVIISHDHYDHLDYNTIKQLAGKVKHVFAPLGVGAHLVLWGVPEANISEFDWWESGQITPDIKLIATPARHFSGRGLTTNKTLWTSYALLTNTHRIYIGGDSGYDTFFKTIGDKYGPFDIAFVESGQYDKDWPHIHLMPEETVQAALDLKAKTLLPIHWGRFTLGRHRWDEPIRRVVKAAEERSLRITTPMIGEAVILDSVYPSKRWWESVQ
jgi:L-ascorbate metabolism protein UlaG (beta-lactamase superfamily)